MQFSEEFDTATEALQWINGVCAKHRDKYVLFACHVRPVTSKTPFGAFQATLVLSLLEKEAA